MARYRRSRRRSATPVRPIVAFLMIACFGILFAGCSRTSTDPVDEIVFTADDLARARELAEGVTPNASGSAAIITFEASPDTPTVDLSMVGTYNAIRSGPSSAPGDLYRVTYDFLNVRSEPKITAPVLSKKEKGELFDVVEFVDAAWAKVRLEDQEGYVSAQYLAKVVPEEQLSATKEKFKDLYFVDFRFLNVRREPNTNSEKLGQLPGQAIIKPLVLENEWARLLFEGEEGYVSTAYLSEFLPTILVRQEQFVLPMLHYNLAQEDAVDAMVRHTQRLRAEGLKPIALREFRELLLGQEARDVRLDPKQVVIAASGITPDNIQSVTSALSRNNMQITVFLQTKDIGLSGITEKNLLSLVSSGQDIQSSGHTGDDLRSLTDAQIDLELKQSRRLLEDTTKKPVYAIFYPQGGTNDRVMQLAAQAGYLFGMSDAVGTNFSRDMLLRLPQLTVDPAQTSDDVLALIRN